MLSTRVATRVTLVPFLGTGVFCVLNYFVGGTKNAGH